MYAFPDMIDAGLKEGQMWPSLDHRTVAIKLGIGNPGITQKDHLTHIVECVCKVPVNKIRYVTPEQMEKQYGLQPFVYAGFSK